MWCGTIRDEPAKTFAVSSQDLVKHVDDRGKTEQAKCAADRSSEPDFGKEKDTSTPVALDWRTIAEYEPPTLSAFFFRHGGQQVVCLLIAEWKECKILVAV